MDALRRRRAPYTESNRSTQGLVLSAAAEKPKAAGKKKKAESDDDSEELQLLTVGETIDGLEKIKLALEPESTGRSLLHISFLVSGVLLQVAMRSKRRPEKPDLLSWEVKAKAVKPRAMTGGAEAEGCREGRKAGS